MSLLPSRPDAEPAEDAGPRVIGVEDDDADDVLAALSSGTARSLLSALHDDPAPPSELADQCDTSLQNVQYHLGKLETAGAVEVVDTAYSEKGREMDVYAPADQPLVVFAGREEDGSTLRTALRRLLGAVGVLALASIVIQSLYGHLPIGAPMGSGDGGGDAGGMAGGGDGDGAGGGGDGGDGRDTLSGDSVDGGSGEPNVTFQGEETTTPTSSQMPADDGATVTPSAEADTPQTAVETATEAPQTETPVQTPMDTVTDTATDVYTAADDLTRTAAEGGAQVADQAASGLPPGLLFFAGGLFVLAVVGVVWYVSANR